MFSSTARDDETFSTARLTESSEKLVIALADHTVCRQYCEGNAMAICKSVVPFRIKQDC
jgi:hypothetical protein